MGFRIITIPTIIMVIDCLVKTEMFLKCDVATFVV